MSTKKAGAIGGEVPTNGGKAAIEHSTPYSVAVKLRGVSSMLFHRWNCEAVEAKANAKKGSAAKKSDDVESYVYRNPAGELCIPGEYLRQAIIMAAKFRQDPRSPRKSAADLFKAAVVATTELASLGKIDWDFLDKRRVTVQRNGITRTRPAMFEGWTATFILAVLVPEYVSPDVLQEVIENAGRLVGIGDFRPTYGRFAVASFEVL